MLWIVLASLLVGAGRFAVPGHSLTLAGSYEAFAHIWVGVLLCMCFTTEGEWWMLALVSLILLSALEVVMFALR
jgi:hypothetical protein